MLRELILTTVGAGSLFREKIEDEIKILEKKGKIKKSDAKDFLKKLEKKGNLKIKELKKSFEDT